MRRGWQLCATSTGMTRSAFTPSGVHPPDSGRAPRNPHPALTPQLYCTETSRPPRSGLLALALAPTLAPPLTVSPPNPVQHALERAPLRPLRRRWRCICRRVGSATSTTRRTQRLALALVPALPPVQVLARGAAVAHGLAARAPGQLDRRAVCRAALSALLGWLRDSAGSRGGRLRRVSSWRRGGGRGRGAGVVGRCWHGGS